MSANNGSTCIVLTPGIRKLNKEIITDLKKENPLFYKDLQENDVMLRHFLNTLHDLNNKSDDEIKMHLKKSYQITVENYQKNKESVKKQNKQYKD
ncbi:MAG: hypothetical protein R3Y59_07865 [bacterium]